MVIKLSQVVLLSYVLVNSVQAFILKDQLQLQHKRQEKPKVDVAEDRFLIFPDLTGTFPFWSPMNYFNLCPYVRPLPFDPVWNKGCAPKPPPPQPPPRVRVRNKKLRPTPSPPAPEIEEMDYSDFYEHYEDPEIDVSDYDEYGYTNSRSVNQ